MFQFRQFDPKASTAEMAETGGVFQRFEHLHRRSGLLSIAVLAVLVVVGGLQSWRSSEAVERQRHVQRELMQINNLRTRVLDIERALQDYISIGDTELARRLLDCEAPCASGQSLANLASLANGDADQLRRYERITGWETSLQHALQTVVQSGGPDEAALRQAQDARSTALRQMQELMLEAEAAELNRMIRHEDRRHHEGLVLQALLAGLFVMALAWLLVMWRRSRALIDAGLTAEQALRALSLRDELTGLANRRALEVHLPRMLRAAQRANRPLALLAIDLDGFKSVNDVHGHAAGDDLLRACAERMLSHVRDTDVVARVGGDEFIVVLDAPESMASARQVGARLLQALGERVAVEHDTAEGHSVGFTIGVTASIGLSMFPDHGATVEALLLRADEASYEAKRHGKNRLCDAGEPPSPLPPEHVRPTLRRVV